MRRIHADLLLLLAAAIWGLAFVFQKTAMESVGPCTFIAARGILAALALWPLALVETRRSGGAPLEADLFRIAAAGGVLFFAGAIFQQVGLMTTTVSNTGFLTGLYVILTPFVVWIWKRRRPKPLIWVAAAITFVGTWLLGGGSLAGLSIGDGFVAICALFWAVHLTVVSASTQFDRPVAFTAVQFAVVGGLGLLVSLATETTTLSGLMAAAPAIAFVGLLSSALTFTLLAVAMKYAPATEAAIIVSLESVFAAIAGAVLLGEQFTAVNIAGAALIMTAIIMVQLVTTKT
jgi:drug/metabolite transporter (DMT)-like permease